MLEKPVNHIFPTHKYAPLPPSQRLHLILLGVDDVVRATRFYRALGWQESATGHAGFAKFNLGGYALCLLPRADLTADAKQESGSGFTGMALVYIARTPEEVPAILAKAEAAGGTIVKPATRTPYGIAGYFKDPDGHLFEVDYEKVWVLDDEQRLVVDEIN
ncbi:MAG TPA: VOC family protein [Cellvibrionaceae bacterium]